MFRRFHDCYRQSQAEVVGRSNNKIYETWGLSFSRALYRFVDIIYHIEIVATYISTEEKGRLSTQYLFEQDPSPTCWAFQSICYGLQKGAMQTVY